MAESSLRATRGQTTAWVLVVLLVLVGIADSIYLLDVHITHKLGQQVVGFCDISEGINCLSAVDSPQSTLLGVPVPVYALAFYAGLLLLVIWAGIRRRREDGLWEVILALFAGGIVYSLYLLYILVFELDAICPGCLILDAVNLLGIVLSCVAGRIGLIRAARRLPVTLLSPGGIRTALAFVISFTLVFVTSTLAARERFRTRLDQANQDMAVSQENFRNLVCGTELWSETGPVASAPFVGNLDAPVVILDFSDFECPYCARLEHTFAEILAERRDQVLIRFLHYPLNMDCNPHIQTRFHPQACLAAQASVCAQEQGKFWELHDLLYTNARHLDRSTINRLARSLDLDMTRFAACLQSEYSVALVRANAVAGHRAMLEAGVQEFGTPFFFVNGLPIRGARPKRVIDAIIDAAMEVVGGHVAEEHAGRSTPPSAEMTTGQAAPIPVSPPGGQEAVSPGTGQASPIRPVLPPVREQPGRPSPE